MDSKFIIIGITGPIASGKRVLTDYLISHYGFTTFSLSTIVHQEVEKRDIKEVTRKTLQDVGNDLREKFGQDILARKALNVILVSEAHPAIVPQRGKSLVQKTIDSGQARMTGVIIEGIRNPAEVLYFRNNSRFYLISIKSNRLYRFKRILARGKPWDPKNWHDFLVVDQRDLGKNESQSGQQVAACMRLADYTLTNNGTVESLQKKVEKLMRKLKFSQT